MNKTLSSIFIVTLACLATTVSAQDSLGEEASSTDPVAEAPSAAGRTEAQSTVLTSPVVRCSHNNLIRLVEVKYDNPGQAVPCSVLYNKETEAPGDIKTLWTAENMAGYCEEKAAGLVDNLKGYGWDCEAVE